MKTQYRSHMAPELRGWCCIWIGPCIMSRQARREVSSMIPQLVDRKYCVSEGVLRSIFTNAQLNYLWGSITLHSINKKLLCGICRTPEFPMIIWVLEIKIDIYVFAQISMYNYCEFPIQLYLSEITILVMNGRRHLDFVDHIHDRISDFIIISTWFQ